MAKGIFILSAIYLISGLILALVVGQMIKSKIMEEFNGIFTKD